MRPNVSHSDGRRPWSSSLLCTICLCATWTQSSYAAVVPVKRSGGLNFPTAPVESTQPVESIAESLAILPSAIPQSQFDSGEQEPLPTSYSAEIPQDLPQPAVSTPQNQLPTFAFPTAVVPSLQIPTLPVITLYPTSGGTIATPIAGSISYSASTDEGLKPIPPAATQTGHPNGHQEVTQPNFSATACRNCAPVEVTAPGFHDNPGDDQQVSTRPPVRTTIAVGTSKVDISQAGPSGGFVIGGSTTVTPGQTVTVDNTPIAVRTSAGQVEVIIGTTVVGLATDGAFKEPRVTNAPAQLPPTINIGGEPILPNSKTEYVVAGQTLSAGGPALTISGTTISLAPSATAVVVNGVTSALAPVYGDIVTTAVPALTLNNVVYTVDRAGYITIRPGVVLKPGAASITVDGTALSLDASGTAVVVQGQTSLLRPATTVVTLTRSSGPGGYGDINGAYTTGDLFPVPTGKSPLTVRPISAGVSLHSRYLLDTFFGGLLIFIWGLVGSLALGL